MSELDSNVKKQLHNAKYVTRLAKHYHQSWDDGSGSASFYYGPPLDVQGDEGFKNYKIYAK